MKTLKLIALAALAFTFSQCKSPTAIESTTTGKSVLEVTRILDTVRRKFIDIAQSNLSLTPGQVIVQTAEWAMTQPNVKDAYWFDSTYIQIEMKSGLQTTYFINRLGSDSLSLARGGGSSIDGGNMMPMVKAKNLLTNKNVLIFAPFADCGSGDFYDKGELEKIVANITDADGDFKVTLLQCDQCKVSNIESFGNYGLVIIDTHGMPDGFITGHIIAGLSTLFDTNDVEIKKNLDHQMPDGYNKLASGNFRFCYLENIGNISDWQTFLKKKAGDPYIYRLMANSKFINSLPPMPNTIIVGNMCFSGWSKPGKTTLFQRGEVNITDPIRTAFMSKQLISYYSYGYDDGTSAPVDNSFAKKMEDSIVRGLTIRKDSTGNAFLNAAGKEFTGKQLKNIISPDLPFKHFGAVDYSYDKCIDVFTDNRDGIIYKVACIGKQTWMAENLRFNAPGSRCYDSLSSNCDTYGRLYDWSTLMDGSSATDANPSKVQGRCPKGWHLPSEGEWMILINELKGLSQAGQALKATTGWNGIGNGTNTSGFSALPAGDWSLEFAQFYHKGINAYYWCTSAESAARGKYLAISPLKSVEIYNSDKQNGLSCRCLKD